MDNVLYSKLRITVPQSLNNGNATITSERGVVKNVQLSSPITDIMLAGMEKYNIQAGVTNEDTTVGYGQIKKVKVEDAIIPPQNLEDCSWEVIQYLIKNGTFKNYYSVGNTKTFTLGDMVYTAEVVSINTGSGTGGQWYPDKTVDFICVELYQASHYFKSDYILSGFPGSNLKDVLNNDIYPFLPADLKEVIIDKEHAYNSNTTGDLVTIGTKLWLPTAFEIFGTANNTYAPGETNQNNKLYTLASKIKSINGGNTYAWYLGTVSSYSSGYIWAVNYDGTSNYTTQSPRTMAGSPICFRIG